MLVLGIESSCDETGVALYDSERGLLAHALHSQIAMHAEFGGVVPELASRDHIRRIVPLLRETVGRAGLPLEAVDAIAYTQGPGLAGALLVGCAFSEALGLTLGKPVLPGRVAMVAWTVCGAELDRIAEIGMPAGTSEKLLRALFSSEDEVFGEALPAEIAATKEG